MRSERKHRTTPLSAIKDSLDPTQEGSQSELLALCSGQFAPPDEDAQLVGGGNSTTYRDHFFNQEQRSLSDSSTQGVRELLGLTVESKKDRNGDRNKETDSIARLFSSIEGASKSRTSADTGFGTQTDSQSYSMQMNEVIGLCSGVFPATQLHPNDSQKSRSSFKLSSHVSSAGTSDGMSDCSDGEGEGGEEREKRKERKMAGDQALLRWAKRQRQIQLGEGSGAKRRGESESEDEDMPLLKRRRFRVKHKPSKQ